MSVSIEEILGSKVKTIMAYVSDPFGGVPVICLSSVVLEDGREFYIEGEHDAAYLPIEKDHMDQERILATIEHDEDSEELIENIEEIFE